MLCDICGKDGARIRRVAETFGKGDDLLVIEDVPLVVCPQCGEGYFTADTLHEIERIRLHRNSFAAARSVEVARFAA
ncbi:MAG: YgiT-type zinc finger protein [bacterium]|nr:YgiT-type zinc finger protein [bacterium]